MTPRHLAIVTGLIAVLLFFGGAARGQLDIGQNHDTSQPIEITADSLEVQQQNQLAVFRGNVNAVQGDLTLRADRLVVHYTKNADNENAISVIEAEGDVFLSSPSEIAQGQKGTYNVEAKWVELVGDVILTRGENIIRGSRLELDLVTGKSTIESGPATETDDGRVKALFVPSSGSTE